MLKKHTSCLFLGLTFLSLSSVVHSANIVSYVGINLIYSNTQFKLDFGHNLFRKNSMGLGLYAGYVFYNVFGIEVGDMLFRKQNNQSTLTHTRDNKINNIFCGQSLLSAAQIASGIMDYDTILIDTTLKQRHPYLGLTAQTKFINENFTIGILLGTSYSKYKAETNIIYAANQNLGAPNTTRTPRILNFSTQELIPMARLKLEFKLNDSFAINNTLTWHKTANLRMTAQENSDYILQPKNNMNIGLGFTWFVL